MQQSQAAGEACLCTRANLADAPVKPVLNLEQGDATPPLSHDLLVKLVMGQDVMHLPAGNEVMQTLQQKSLRPLHGLIKTNFATACRQTPIRPSLQHFKGQ